MGEKEVLIDRCCKGIGVLQQGLEAIKLIVPEDFDPRVKEKSEIWNTEMDKWKEAQNRLWALVQQLHLQYEFYECLFIPDKEWTPEECQKRERDAGQCWACPRDWEKIIFPKPEPAPERISLFGNKMPIAKKAIK